MSVAILDGGKVICLSHGTSRIDVTQKVQNRTTSCFSDDNTWYGFIGHSMEALEPVLHNTRKPETDYEAKTFTVFRNRNLMYWSKIIDHFFDIWVDIKEDQEREANLRRLLCTGNS